MPNDTLGNGGYVHKHASSIFPVILRDLWKFFVIICNSSFLNFCAILPLMRRNHEVIDIQNLLTPAGTIAEEGWARYPVWKYNRKDIKASAFKIKEWDYYAVVSHKHNIAVCGTISDLGYAGLFAMAFVDYKSGKCAQTDAMKFLTLGRTGLSAASKTDNTVCFKSRKLSLHWDTELDTRHITIKAPGLILPNGQKGFEADISLYQDPVSQSMNIATSWKENRKAFYLNEKVNCMPATGTVKLGNETLQLSPDEASGVLDWGRGRWTYKNTWYWASGNGFANGHSFGFNLGYGFTDRTPASENVIFYDGVAHKINDVNFYIPDEDFTKPWAFTSSDGRFEMDFIPAVDRSSHMDFKIIASEQHQVFGYFTGQAVLDNGEIIEVKDFPAFAEKVYNKY